MLVRSWHTQVGACQCVLRSIVADVLGMKEACWFARSYPNSIEPVLLLSRSKKFRKFQDPPFLRPSSRIQLLKQPRSLESLSQANHPCKRFRTSSTGNHVKLFYLVESYKHAIASTWWPMLAIHSSVALIAADVKSELNSASALKWRLDRSSESCLIIFSRRYPRAYSSVENCWIFFILFFILSYPYTRPILRESLRIKQDYRNESSIYIYIQISMFESWMDRGYLDRALPFGRSSLGPGLFPVAYSLFNFNRVQFVRREIECNWLR